MYIVIITVIVLIIFLFGSTMFKLFTSYSSNDYQKGNIWFISLLVINIIVIIFLCMYNYHISNKVGLQGNFGPTGQAGSAGVPCYVGESKNKFYKQYTKTPSPI